MRIAWKPPNFSDHLEEVTSETFHRRIQSNATDLVQYFLELYSVMFCHEVMNMVKLICQTVSPLAVDLRHYNRLSFVLLLCLAKSRIQTDWPSLMMSLVDKIESDREFLVGSNSLQELHVLLHLSGLFSNRVLERSPREIGMTPYGRPRPPAADTGLLGRSDVPSVVFVALTVPREKLAVFTDEDINTIGTPGLHLSFTNPDQGFYNKFFAIQCFFGTLSSVANDDSICNVLPDDRG